MVLHRAWEELHGSSPGDSIESCALALGHCTSLHVHGSLRTLFPMGMRCQGQPVTNVSTISLLGCARSLVNHVSQRKENQGMSIPASGGLSVLSGSVIAGSDFLSLAEPL